MQRGELREIATHRRKVRTITQDPGKDSSGILNFKRRKLSEKTHKEENKMMKENAWVFFFNFLNMRHCMRN